MMPRLQAGLNLPGRNILPASAIPAVLYLCAMLVTPLVILVAYSFWKADFFTVTRTFTFENYQRLFGSPLFLSILGKTLMTSLAVSLIVVFIAYQIAYSVVFRFKVWGPRILVIIMASLLSSYIVRLYALTTILGTNGILNNALMGVGMIDAPLRSLLYGYPAIIITLVYVYLPIAVLPIFAGLQGIDRRLIEASHDLGMGPVRTFVRVTLPLSLRGTRTAFAFCFILAAADYVAPRMVGGMNGQMIGSIIADQFGGASNYPFGATLSIAMIGGFSLVLGACYVVERLIARMSRLKLWRPIVTAGQHWNVSNFPLTEVVTLASLVFIFSPLLTVLVFSFNDTPNPGLPFNGFTTHWYADVIHDPQFHRVLATSLKIGSICMFGSLLLGIPAAIVLARRNFMLKRPVNILVFAPMAVPGVVIGVALLATFIMLNIRLGQATAAAAHVMLVIPFIVQIIRTRMEMLDESIEEAAYDLGSTPLRAFRTVTLPILLPAILGAGILAAAISLDELLVTNFTIGREATIPVWIASQMRTGLTPALNAVAIMMLLGSLGLIGLAAALMRWKGLNGNRTKVEAQA